MKEDLTNKSSGTPAQTPIFAQESHWLQAVDQKKRVERSASLSWINRYIRIPLSISAQRDRFFLRFIRRGNPRQEILDVGCGSGRRYLAEYGVVTGIDLTPALLEEAKAIYRQVFLHDILDMGPVLQGKKFDIVTSSDVIGHIPFEQKDRLYNELAAATRIGGISLHFIECKHDTFWTNIVQRRWPELFQKYYVERVGHIGMEAVDEIVRQFTRSGFTVVHLEKVPGYFPGVGFLSSFTYPDFQRVIPVWLKLMVRIDAMLAGNIFVREVLNVLLSPIAWLDSHVTPIKKTTAIMIAAKRVS